MDHPRPPEADPTLLNTSSAPATDQRPQVLGDQYPQRDADPISTQRPGPRPPAAPVSERRAQRAQDLLEEALQNPDALEANLGVVTADLVGFAHQLQKSLLVSTGDRSFSGGRRDTQAQKIQLYLSIARQVERQARVQLSQRARGANREQWGSENTWF